MLNPGTANGGAINLGANVTTGGAQTYNGNIVLAASDISLASSSGGILVSGSITTQTNILEFLLGGKYLYNGVSYTASTPGTGAITQNSDGTYSWTSPYTGSAKLLVVGGGGGGGGENGGAGGGAGGLIYDPNIALSAGSTYLVRVGAGGAGGGDSFAGDNGGESEFGGRI